MHVRARQLIGGTAALCVAGCGSADVPVLGTSGHASVDNAVVWSDSEEARALDWADWDLDGDLDLLVGGQFRLSVYANVDGELALAWETDEYHTITDVAWGVYFDGDPYPDVAVARNQDPVVVLENTGAGSLEPRLLVPGPEDANETTAVAWGDADGDRDLDLAVAYAGSFARLFLNDGDGEISSPAEWQSDDNGVIEDLVWADVDGDGRPDLTVVGATWWPTTLYLNSGAGLGDGLELISDGFSTTDVSWGDFDGDGDLDLAAAHRGGGDGPPAPVHVYRFEDGGPVELCWESEELEHSEGIAWGDKDGDGDLDLAVANVDGDPDRIYETVPDPTEPCGFRFDDEGPIPHDAESYDVAWADVDGDGELEVAFAREGSPSDADLGPIVFGGDGPSLVPQPWLDDPDSVDRDLDWGDFDGDRDFDLALAGEDGARVIRLLDDDTFHPVPVWEDGRGEPTNAVAWGDVDDDGDLDLAVGYSEGNAASIRLFLNEDGQLGATDAWAYADDGRCEALAWGDFDDDHDLDLAAAFSGEPLRVFENVDGELVVVFTSEATASYGAVAWADIDGDQDLDLAADGPDGRPVVYRSVDGALEADPWSPATSTGSVRSLAWGDRDGDGDLDLAVAGSQDFGFAVYDNVAGTLLPTPSLQLQGGEAQPRAVAWGDWDGDGLPELATGTSGDTTHPVVVLDDVGGSLLPVWTAGADEATRDLAWADFDGDGDLDLAGAAASTPSRLYVNHRRDPDGLAAGAPQVRWAVNEWGWPATPSGHGESVPRGVYAVWALDVVVTDRESDAVDLRFQFGSGNRGWIDDERWHYPGVEASPEGEQHLFHLEGFEDHDPVDQERWAVRAIVTPAETSTIGRPVQRAGYGITTPAWRITRRECWPWDDDGDGDPCSLDGERDCDDQDPTVYRGAPEICDGIDNDCDPETPIDEGADFDGDGFSCADDCDDSDAAVGPHAVEICDAPGDEDCSGAADADDPECWSAGGCAGCATVTPRSGAPAAGPSGGEGLPTPFAALLLAACGVSRRRRRRSTDRGDGA